MKVASVINQTRLGLPIFSTAELSSSTHLRNMGLDLDLGFYVGLGLSRVGIRLSSRSLGEKTKERERRNVSSSSTYRIITKEMLTPDRPGWLGEP